MRKLIIGLFALTLVFGVALSQKDSKADERSAIAGYTCRKLETSMKNGYIMLDTKKKITGANLKFAQQRYDKCINK